MKGKVWKFGNDVDTDAISPTKYASDPQETLMKHVLDVINPKFPMEVKPGDIIVAGSNFGCGSSRENAPAVVKALGVGAIVAESFARIFFRNCIAIGLPAVTCSDVSGSFEDGDELELDLGTGKITNLTKGKNIYAQPLPEQMVHMLLQGGILPVLKDIASKQT